MDNDQRIRCFVPLQRLPEDLQDKAVALARITDYGRGQSIYLQGQHDDLVHYLLSGAVELLWHGKVSRSVSATHKVALRPLDPPGRKRYTVRAVDQVSVVTFKRAALEQLVSQHDSNAAEGELEVSEIASTRSSDWMIRMLQSELFSVLPAVNIQKIFARMEQISLKCDEVVVNQGSPGDYYYVVEQGYCEVSRTIAAGRGHIHLADLGPGTAFGEEALISGKPRNATVTMLSDGRLMRLARDDFFELILNEVLKPIDFAAARAQIAQGAVWLDVRYPEDHAQRAFQASENIPVNMLRLQSNRLRRDFRYIVCGDDLEQCAIAAFLLGERGFDVAYLAQSITEIAALEPSAVVSGAELEAQAPRGTLASFPGVEARGHEPLGPAATADDLQDLPLDNTITRISKLYTHAEARREMRETIPVETYADTTSGRDLAAIIDELSVHHDELAPTGAVEVAAPLAAPRVEAEAAADAGIQRLDTDSILQDGISVIMRELESRLRQQVTSAFASRQQALVLEHAEEIARMRERTNEEMRQREARFRETLSAAYDEKEQLLRSYYKKLIALANNISRQKAQLQDARRQFELKLTSANEIYREVEEMRQILTEHIGHPDEQVIEGLPRMNLSI